MRFLLALLFPVVVFADEAPGVGKVLSNVPYVPGGGVRQQLDLRVPAAKGAKPPLIVWIHGGGWSAGAKDIGMSKFLEDAGFAVAAINYRYSTQAIFPAQLLDCKAAIRWLRAHADEYGYDGTRIGVWGHSAGGHLVALLGTTGDVKAFDQGENLTISSRVQAVADVDGPSDLTFFPVKPNGLIEHLLGGPVTEKAALAQQANPISYVTRDDPPFLILQVADDPIVPAKNAEALGAALDAAKVDVTVKIYPGNTHFPEGPEPMAKVREFFRRTLR